MCRSGWTIINVFFLNSSLHFRKTLIFNRQSCFPKFHFFSNFRPVCKKKRVLRLRKGSDFREYDRKTNSNKSTDRINNWWLSSVHVETCGHGTTAWIKIELNILFHILFYIENCCHMCGLSMSFIHFRRTQNNIA